MTKYQFEVDVHLYLLHCSYCVTKESCKKDGYFLVYAKSFDKACDKLKRIVKNPTDIQNRSVGLPEPILEMDL